MINLYINEEYGYRLWVCRSSMSEQQLIDWWENLETVMPYFYNPSKVLEFGKVSAVDDETWIAAGEKRYLMHLHTDGDSYLGVGDETYFHKGYDPHYFGGGEE